jgi:hypothetical protein
MHLAVVSVLAAEMREQQMPNAHCGVRTSASAGAATKPGGS